jgi:hypothetical protein
MVKCICIDDENRPAQIPASKWVKKDNEYHITFVAFCLPQSIQGLSLYELPLDESCSPYQYFKASRFAIHKEDWDAFIELCKDCTDLNELEITKLVEDAQLEVV